MAIFLNDVIIKGDISSDSFIKSGGTSSQYLMADGSISTGGVSANNSLVTINTATGLDGATTFTLNQASDKVINLSLDFTEFGNAADIDYLVGLDSGNNEKKIAVEQLQSLNRAAYYITGNGNTKSYNVSHSLGYTRLVIQVYDTKQTSPYYLQQVYPTIKHVDYQTYNVSFGKNVPSGQTYTFLAIAINEGVS